MKTLRDRATALTSLPASQPDARGLDFCDALEQCIDDMLQAGEHAAVFELMENVCSKGTDHDEVVAFRIFALRARVLVANRHEAEGLDLATKLLDKPQARDPNLLRYRHGILLTMGRALWRQNRIRESTDLLLDLYSALVRMADSTGLAVCCLEISSAYLLGGEREKSRNFGLEALVSARRANNEMIEAEALGNLAVLAQMACNWHNAREFGDEALSRFSRLGNRNRAARAARRLAIVAWKRGRLADAAARAEECIRDARAQGSRAHEWFASLLRGMILLHSGDAGRAKELFTAGANWDIPRSTSRPSLLTTEFLGDVHLDEGEIERALALYDEVFPKAMALVPKGDIVAELRRRRAECYLLLGRAEESYAEAATGLQHCTELGDRYEGAATHRILALSSAALGRDDEAKRWFRAGFDHYEEIETPYEWGKLWLAYGDWLSGDKAGSYASDEEALAAYRSAFDLFDRMGAKARRNEAERRLETLTARVSGGAPPTPGNSSSTAPPPRPRRRPNSEVEKRSRWAFQTLGILTHDRGLLSVIDDVEKVAKSRKPVLVVGESGTGKELIASALHELSGRSGTYMPINCAAIPREIIESELFGHLAGSFTGSTRDKVGLLEVCDKGTVFLDEIGEMPVELQSRLLRFLETGELRRVGATRNQRVSTRVVAATNVDLSTLESGDAFRRDLFYRLAHLVIELPPLRIRRGDILLLAEHFLREAASEEGKSISLSEAAVERLQTYSWPGNVRQLRSEMSRVALLLPDGHVVRPIDLRLRDADTPGTLTQELGQAEKRRVADAMTRSHGSKSEAAKALGIPRTTLINKLKRYGLFR